MKKRKLFKVLLLCLVIIFFANTSFAAQNSSSDVSPKIVNYVLNFLLVIFSIISASSLFNFVMQLCTGQKGAFNYVASGLICGAVAYYLYYILYA